MTSNPNPLFNMTVEAPALNHALLEAAIRPMTIDELLRDLRRNGGQRPLTSTGSLVSV